jgi:hypothetical protein
MKGWHCKKLRWYRKASEFKRKYHRHFYDYFIACRFILNAYSRSGGI